MAFYKIKKLRKSLLYITTPALAVIGISLLIILNVVSDTEKNPEKFAPEELVGFSILMIFSLLVAALGLIALSNYLMHKWSEDWNKQFPKQDKNMLKSERK